MELYILKQIYEYIYLLKYLKFSLIFAEDSASRRGDRLFYYVYYFQEVLLIIFRVVRRSFLLRSLLVNAILSLQLFVKCYVEQRKRRLLAGSSYTIFQD